MQLQNASDMDAAVEPQSKPQSQPNISAGTGEFTAQSGAGNVVSTGEDTHFDTAVLLKQLRSFQELASFAIGQLPQHEQATPIQQNSVPPFLHTRSVPDTPLYSTSALPAETPPAVGGVRGGMNGLLTPASNVQQTFADPCTPQNAPLSTVSTGPWEATPEARAILHGQQELVMQLQRVLENPGTQHTPSATLLKELQGSILRATAMLQQSRALHNIEGALADARSMQTPPAAHAQGHTGDESMHSSLPAHQACGDPTGQPLQPDEPLEEFQGVLSSSQRMQSLLSSRLGASKGQHSHRGRPDGQDRLQSPPDAELGAALAYRANNDHVEQGMSESALHGGGTSTRKRWSLGPQSVHNDTAGLEQQQQQQDRRGSWQDRLEPHAPVHAGQRRSSSAAQEPVGAPATLDDSKQDSDEIEPLAGITREVNRLLNSPDQPAPRRWTLDGVDADASEARPGKAANHRAADHSERPVQAGRRATDCHSLERVHLMRQADSKAAPLATGGRGSPDMEIHCNPLFGAEGAPAAADKGVTGQDAQPGPSGQTKHKESSGRAITQLAALLDPEEDDGQPTKHAVTALDERLPYSPAAPERASLVRICCI